MLPAPILAVLLALIPLHFKCSCCLCACVRLLCSLCRCTPSTLSQGWPVQRPHVRSPDSLACFVFNIYILVHLFPFYMCLCCRSPSSDLMLHRCLLPVLPPVSLRISAPCPFHHHIYFLFIVFVACYRPAASPGAGTCRAQCHSTRRTRSGPP